MQGLLARDLVHLDLVVRLLQQLWTGLGLDLLDFDGGFVVTGFGGGRGWGGFGGWKVGLAGEGLLGQL